MKVEQERRSPHGLRRFLFCDQRAGGSMAKLKTQPTKASVRDFIKSVGNEQICQESLQVLALMERATQSKGKMWGSTIVGCGERKLKYADGSEADWMQMGFAPRKDKITFYLAPFKGKDQLLAKLGKHKGSKACVHIRRLSDIDLAVLEKLIKASAKFS
jgi:hypothetical protein